MTKTQVKMVFIKGRPVPKLCECGGYSIIGGKEPYNVGSFFWNTEHAEWVCCGCGLVL